MRGYRWAVARKRGCIGLSRDGRILCRPDFPRARMVRIFSKPIQSHAGRNVRWRAHRDSIITLVMVARLCITHLVWMEISKLHHLANRAAIAATDLFAVPQEDRRR